MLPFGDFSLLVQLYIPVEPAAVSPLLPLGTELLDVQLEVKLRVGCPWLRRLAKQLHTRLSQSVVVLGLVALDAAQHQVRPSAQPALRTRNNVIEGVLVRLERHTARHPVTCPTVVLPTPRVLTLAVVTQRNVATREGDAQLHPLNHVVLCLDDAGHVHLNGRGVQHHQGVFLDDLCTVFPVHLDGTLPAYKPDGPVRQVKNQCICHSHKASLLSLSKVKDRKQVRVSDRRRLSDPHKAGGIRTHISPQRRRPYPLGPQLRRLLPDRRQFTGRYLTRVNDPSLPCTGGRPLRAGGLLPRQKSQGGH